MKKPDAPEEGPKGSNVFDRLNEGLTANPKKAATLVVAIVVVGLIIKFGYQYFTEKSASDQDRQYVEILAAGGTWAENLWGGVSIDTQRDAKARLEALRDVSTEAREGEYGAYYWWLTSKAAWEAAEAEEDPDEKIRLFTECRDACNQLETKHPDSVWMKVPWKSSQTEEIHPSLVVRRRAYCEAQIKFIEEHKAGVGGTAEADPGVEASLTLTDENDPKVTHTFKIRTFSEAAPYAVEQFLQNLREKKWDGTHIYAIHENDPNTATIDAVSLGSPLSRSPWATDLHGQDKDWVGFTLPIEPNRQEPKRGTIAFELHRDNGQVSGVSPTNLVIHLSDHPKPAASNQARVVFAEIVDDEAGKAAMTWLENLAFDDTKPVGPQQGASVYAPKLTIRVTGGEPKGTPKVAPSMPLLKEWIDPEQPEKPKEDPKPENEGDDKNKKPDDEKDDGDK